MGKVVWGGGVDADTFDSAERNQFKPYGGPTPPNGMYAFRIKVLKKGKAKSSGNPQLIIGLELVPRRSRPDEKQYAGYFLTEYISVVDSQAWKVAPFLDAINVTGRDFVARTTDDGEPDERGSVKIVKIGNFINNGKHLVLATIADDTTQDGTPRKRIATFWPVEEQPASKEEPEEDDNEDDEDDAPPPRKAAKKAAPKKRAPEPEPDDEDDDDEEPPAKPVKKAVKKAAPKRRQPEPEEDDADDDDDEDDEAPF